MTIEGLCAMELVSLKKLDEHNVRDSLYLHINISSKI